MNNQLDPAQFARLAWIVLYGARTIAYLSKTKQTITGSENNDIMNIIGEISQELAIEEGWKI
jgi:hypothetical protein